MTSEHATPSPSGPEADRLGGPPDDARLRGQGSYGIRRSEAPDDPAWDSFLAVTAGGNYAQTAAWGRVRATIGWQPARVVVTEADRIVAGVQILTRPLPIGGSLGRVSWGPVVPEGHPELLELVLDELLALSRDRGVRYLIVHAPRQGAWMCEALRQRGLRPSFQEVEYTATAFVDLNPDLDQLFAAMSKRCREHIRAARRRGVTVRRGSAADLPTFSRLKDIHAARLGYERLGDRYFEELWSAFAPQEQAVMFVAEADGEPLSVLFAIRFGQDFYNIERLWSGERGELRANELLVWEALEWAKGEGCTYFDLVGLARDVAEEILSGNARPDRLSSTEAFKLTFGARPLLLPESYDYVVNPALRFVYRLVPRSMLTAMASKGLADRARTLAWGKRTT